MQKSPSAALSRHTVEDVNKHFRRYSGKYQRALQDVDRYRCNGGLPDKAAPSETGNCDTDRAAVLGHLCEM